MTTHPPDRLDELEDIFYRSKFGLVVSTIDEMEKTGDLHPKLALIRANALFELHRVKEARQALEQVKSQIGENEGESEAGENGLNEDFLYALARISSFDNKKQEALRIVDTIRANASHGQPRFRATLGKANILYSMREWSKIVPLIEELCQFDEPQSLADRISLMIFLGRYYLYSNASLELARNYFRKAFAAAAGASWTYFVARCLYELASICEQEKKHQELAWTLEMLRSFIDDSEQLYYAHMVNNRFKSHFSIDTPMEFDEANNRILIKNNWIAFHDKPMLFRFLYLLHGTQAFVTKATIATDLWPKEEYKPRVHDPRIFDIAKRARNLIEAYESQPVVLLSGRMGYKLASV